MKVHIRLFARARELGPDIAASADEIDRLAAGKRDVHVLHGWRNEIFGKDAVALLEGRLALSLKGDHAQLIPVPVES